MDLCKKYGFNYYDTRGHYYEGIGRIEIGTLIHNPK